LTFLVVGLFLYRAGAAGTISYQFVMVLDFYHQRRKYYKNSSKINAKPARGAKRRNTKMIAIVHQALPSQAKTMAKSTSKSDPTSSWL